ncbi:iron-sulfur cluster-binding protein [Caldimonas thermodepolymerans]|jgi:L-lactate dehydrogenase complex protein LldF|uniref:Iron-sulfur cluster-binding protein n=1 Tax=Caldimonas thermodepolymerans TaxID=215580 RepID=A0A2S5T640_9BURK|nr:LutB/LldF family L-lactate oxidation iron-sulfur protein [Caldimonas thermodepolymerans]PPE70412.1 iron-sulfur cluster-binding protein [Caldimonas thermodepolymerans]QPC30320.1 iron-sulfur cluster-binding protein [Caldimonas thermodepolymerans]RDI00719.1 L-lactate dehydrogenase complex protein LldF [Caldimonas thermodepolymerans]
MQVQSMHFKARAGERLADQRLQKNLKKLSTKFVTARAQVVQELEEFEAIRNEAVRRRKAALAKLDVWLERFEREATRRGATVLWAETPAEAAQLVVEIARKHEVRRATKTKSMVSEEMALNKALEAAGVQVTETDLGEYILQINDGEPPSHIIAPVVHKDKEEIYQLFVRTHQLPREPGRVPEIPEMTREARQVLRSRFLASEMGITGGNFLVAETGSVALVTNEGNEGLCTAVPRVHVAITGVEKVLPTLEDLATIMRLLPRSATGQVISNYFSLLTGPRGAGERDGPEHMYFILVDGGRTGLLGGDFEEMLRCIRCGACMNHCPVYQKIGGHSYGWVYPGPMGSVLTSSYVGLEQTLDLPQAATMCGQCHVVCPMKIPLPDLLRKLRERQFERGLRPWPERLGLRVWGYVAQRPALYRTLARLGVRVLRWMSDDGRIRRLPLASGWTDTRDLPAPAGKTFKELYAERRR